MSKLVDETGNKFGRLTVVTDSGERTQRGFVVWECVCDCGEKKTVDGSMLRRGQTKSCGCLAKEVTIKTHTTHGMTGTTEHNIWRSMLQRCYNVNHKAYKYYGGRGITVCRRWRNSFISFYRDMGNRPNNKSIDRINNNSSYGKWNCKWSTNIEQNNNRRLRYA